MTRLARNLPLADTLLVITCFMIPVIYAGWAKTLWIDEFLHFAMGGMDFREALTTIWSTTGSGVNWGQTGTYFFLNYALESIFGAQLFALRLPSIITGTLLLGSAVLFLRLCGLSRVWQFALLIVFAAQSSLLYYAGEARPYMPMASFAIAALAYYRFPIDRRSSWLARFIGIYALIIGALFHPYWIAFIAMAIVFSFWNLTYSGTIQRNWNSFMRFVNFPMLGIGILLYFILGALTWLKSRSDLAYDPWEYLLSPTGWLQTIINTHLSVLYLPNYLDEEIQSVLGESARPSRTLAIIIPLIMVLVPAFWRRLRPRFAPPAVLLTLALLSTLALSALSYLQGYWVLQRQWLGGMAITSLALVWWIGELDKSIDKRKKILHFAVAAGFVGLATLNAYEPIKAQVQGVANRGEVWDVYANDDRSPTELLKKTQADGDWVYMGNVNIARGGPVWPEVAVYYGIAP